MTVTIGRRELLAALGGAAATWPLAARAQQPGMPAVGFLNAGIASAEGYRPMMAAFRQGLQESGYVDGQNVTIEYRWAEGQTDRLPEMAADLVHRKVTVIVATTAPAALAATAATTTIPIVFETAGDPIRLGLVVSLNRPGGNVTGVTSLGLEVTPKRLELLHELVPTAIVIALLINRANPALAEPVLRASQAAAQTLGLNLHILNASIESDFDAVFANVLQLRAGGLVIGADPVFTSRQEQLAALSLRHAVPTVYQNRASSRLAVWQAIARVPTLTVWRASTPPAFSKAKSLANYRYNRPRKLSCSSTLRPQRVSALPCHCHSSAAPTR